MKTKIYSLLLGGMLLVASCSDFTDLKPKGVNMLENVTDLEMLLNREYGGWESQDMFNLVGDYYYAYSSIPTTIKQTPKTRTGIIWSYDEAAWHQMVDLTSADYEYESWYGAIGKIANPIISMVDASKGDENTKKRIKAEAYVMRAWCHFLAVNKFAPGYNPATAASTPAVPYLTEDWDIQQPTVKATLQEVYDNIVADLDAAIALNALPTVPVNKCRFGIGAAYALKALALQNMQKWNEAAEAAEKALAVNNTVLNYWSKDNVKYVSGMLTGKQYEAVLRAKYNCPEDYFSTMNSTYYLTVTNECVANLEDGAFFPSRIPSYDMMYDYMFEMLMEGKTPAQYIVGIDAATVIMDFDFDSDWNYYGFKTTQMYLVLAEAAIHNGQYEKAMQTLDILRVNRIDPAKYAPLAGTGISTEAEAMKRLKQSSRLENVLSCYNFINQKRWNQVAGWEDTITHKLGNETYSLAPNSKLWAFPFPKNVTNNNPNIQNED